ncbi:MAG TPA: type II secretion system F family protein [Actinomycetaceae bacterium]|nr:type II secretion system F family protein [Actinomycetaceae bacterium]
MTGWVLGALIGAIGGAGFWLITWTWSRRRITLAERVAPYSRERPRGSRLLQSDAEPSPFGPFAAALRPLVQDLSRGLERLGSSEVTIAARLREAGRTTTVEQFRLEQVAWACLGGGAGLILALAVAARGGNLVAGVVLVAVGALGSALAADYSLSIAARRRTERILAELPDLAELAALAVGAGESPAKALERVSSASNGELATEFGDVVARSRTGVPFTRALEELANRTTSPELARFADAIVVATERGTPLAAVLRAQAADLRESARARLLEVGGNKELWMMAPVVFLVLPITVIFALFPGLAMLQVGM